MAFPNSPSDGQQTTVSNVTYQYNSAKTAWYRVGTVANPITSTVDYYTGNGVQTTFSLSAVPSAEEYTFVAVGGVLQPRNTYSLSGSSLTFSGPPPNLTPVEITTFGGSGGSVYGNNSVAVYLPNYTGNVSANSVLAGGFYWSNGTPFASSTYSNVEVAAYIPTDSTIIGINANVASTNANVTAANAAIVTANSAVVSYVNSLNSAMAANVAGANAAIVTANTAMKSYIDSQVIASGGYSNVAMTSYLATNDITVGNITGGGVRTTSSSTPPATKSVGDIWYSTGEDRIYRYTSDGTTKAWLDITGADYTFDMTGEMAITGNIIPTANVTYSLGSSAYRFKDLYLSGNTIYLGNTALSATTISNSSTDARYKATIMAMVFGG